PRGNQQRWQAKNVQKALHIPHYLTSERTDVCQDKTRRSTARTTMLIMTPNKPVANTSEYIDTYAPPDWARAISAPRPGDPIINWAVMAKISATAAAKRIPVTKYGNAVGNTTYRIRLIGPNP